MTRNRVTDFLEELAAVALIAVICAVLYWLFEG